MKTSESLSDKRMDPELDARAAGKAVETSNLDRASDALADLSRALAPGAAETFTPLENALSDWHKPRTITDLGPQFPALLRAHTRVSKTTSSATSSIEPSSLTLHRACASGSPSLHSQPTSSSA